MAALTFIQVLKAEVARMQALHPEREGEIARAHALILHGMVLPSADDPQTGQVLSSDGEKRYTVNGSCNCQAGQHGKGCKHMQAWKLYQYISKKVEAQPTPALPEAPASVNCHIMLEGRQVQLTLRDSDETRLLARLQAVLAQFPAPQPPAQAASPEGGWCPIHTTPMKLNKGREGKRDWWSHKTAAGQWCKGK